MKTEYILPEDIDYCIEALNQNECVVFATDTVFGVAARTDSYEAYQALVKAKQRPESKPFPIMVSSLAQIQTLAVLTERDRLLIQRWMPGAVTFIFNRQPDLEDYLTNGLESVGIRMPDDPWILELIDRVGVPLFVPSANQSGQPTAATLEEARKQMDGEVRYIVQGSCKGGLASTIIDARTETLHVLRQGALRLEDILDSLQ